jgi:hypothetical protein
MARTLIATALLTFFCQLVSAQQHYAVLIQGGQGGQLWSDTYLMYQALKENGFDSSKIYVLYANGTPEFPTNPRYNPGEDQIAIAPATMSSIQSTFGDLQQTMTSNDILFI